MIRKQKPSKDERVLVLDDDQQIRDLISEMLHRMGYKTELVEEGKLAIKLYAQALKAGKPFDVVILDLTIPGGMGGAETMDKLLSMDPNVNAIVCSGNSSDPIINQFEKYGFKAALKKPFRFADLKKTLDRLMDVTVTINHCSPGNAS